MTLRFNARFELRSLAWTSKTEANGVSLKAIGLITNKWLATQEETTSKIKVKISQEVSKETTTYTHCIYVKFTDRAIRCSPIFY